MEPPLTGASSAGNVLVGKAPGRARSVFRSCVLTFNFFFYCSFLPFDKAVKIHDVLILYKFSLQTET